ncbi:tRNA-guanine transglycosylase [Methanoregula sp. UBA64]|jgi:7-cyano-7-deazaguanine tRNA-ribosyltransferase|uniref:tRNA-guanine transglycosylase n=1 Tax=Methanoregula sp. UBA64 TaxID=1915554 RepID=UPI0025FAF542|nr:tRNA-guanine transglycosylase [Methanoregula sp. UBA64]
MLQTQKCIETPHGTLETPVFFPVFHLNTRGSGSCPKYWNEIPELKTMLVNAHGIQKSERFHRILKNGFQEQFHFPGIVFADSGGLQNRLNNLKLDPVEILRVQEGIGADIAATLDMPVLANDNISATTHAENVKATVQNAITALKYREREDMLLYAVIHGNDLKVMTNMIDYLKRKGNFDGYAVGGLIFKRSNYRQLIDLIINLRKRAGEKPLHVFGLGGPLVISLLTYLGVDSFDSSSFLSAGSQRVYFTPDHGSRQFREMPQTPYLPCICPVCSKNTFEQIRSQRRLIGMHNLWMIAHELRKLKVHILDQDLEDYLDNRFANRPQIKIAYKYAKAKTGGFV